MLRQNRLLLMAIVLFPLPGCSLFIDATKVELETVEGTVVLDGKPLSDAKLLFLPLNRNLGHRFATSFGITDSDGKFSLRLSDGRPGAFAGWHLILVSKIQRDARPADAWPAVGDIESPAVATPGIPNAFEGSGQDFEFAAKPHDLVPRYYNVETELKFEVVAGSKNQATLELSSVDPLLKPFAR